MGGGTGHDIKLKSFQDAQQLILTLITSWLTNSDLNPSFFCSSKPSHPQNSSRTRRPPQMLWKRVPTKRIWHRNMRSLADDVSHRGNPGKCDKTCCCCCWWWRCKRSRFDVRFFKGQIFTGVFSGILEQQELNHHSVRNWYVYITPSKSLFPFIERLCCWFRSFSPDTPRKINMEPENAALEKEKHLPNHHFQFLCWSLVRV